MSFKSRFASSKGWLSATLLMSLVTACGGEPVLEEGGIADVPETPAVDATPGERTVSAQVYYHPISSGTLTYNSWQQKSNAFSFVEISCGGVRISYGPSNVQYNRTVRAKLFRSTDSGATYTNVTVNGGRSYVDTTIALLSNLTLQPMEPDVTVTHATAERWYVLLELLNRRTTDSQGWKIDARCG